MAWGVSYIIEKLLEHTCLKWAHIAHLDIWNTSYGQKKGWESNWQFDSWPLKVGNRPNSLACRWRVTYRWKALDKGYNFALDLIYIGGFLAKLCGLKVVGIPTLAISGLPLGNPGTKTHLDVGPVGGHRVYYKGEGGGFPKSVCPSCPWLVLTPKVRQPCINHFVLVLCRSVWIVEACQLFLVPSWSSNLPFNPPKVLRARERALTPYSFVVFCFDSHLSPSRSWECVKKSSKLSNDLVESIGVIWLCDKFMGWIGKGKLGTLIELIGLGGYVKLLKKNWSKRRSCIWLTISTCISLCGEKIGVSSKVTSIKIIIFFVDLTWSLYSLDYSMYPRKMHSWNGILICA